MTKKNFTPNSTDPNSRSVRIQTMVPEGTSKELSELADSCGISVSALVLQMINYCLEPRAIITPTEQDTKEVQA